MKKILFLSNLVILLFVVGCSKDDDFGGQNVVQPIDFTVDLSYNESFGDIQAEGVSVTLTETNSSQVYTVTSNAQGIALFEEINPGTYSLTASIAFTKETFEQTFGYDSNQDETNFNASQGNVVINENVTTTAVELKTAKVGDLLIKQIYYAGSHVADGASFRDQFIEIHNNSNEVIYADGLYIAQLFGNTSMTVKDYTLSNGQFDWSKSIGMTLGNEANTDYIYADFVYKVPGNGEQYPIQPGESIVIAQTAVNHKANYTDNAGNTVEITSPELTVDLSGADFEVFIGDDYPSDIQTGAADMEVTYFRAGKDMVFDTNGRDGFAIFRTDADVASFPLFRSPKEAETKEPAYMQIPNNVIIDAVDITREDLSTPKKLPSELDASNIHVPLGKFSSQSVIRKTKTTIGSRVVLEDTNNSENDFTTLNVATPKGFAQ
ncbi:DUF4876 domain-containing protein [Aureivirga marina]|uniref:DUF4876 domain-containing protein n=1 Tax=Aureivirga marina TaxID=1182451 RepID=UPI0018C948B6|nr:DUF4876 domain-containing protein [Aureivirga marina]